MLRCFHVLRTALFTAVFSLSLSNPTLAQTLHVGAIERPPYLYANADGTVKGQIARQLVSVFKEAQIDARLDTHPIDGVNTFFSRDELDVLIATETIIDDPDEYLVSELPILILQFYAYHLPETPQVQNKDDLFGHSVIWPLKLDDLRGGLKDWLVSNENRMNIVANQNDLELALPMLESGEAQYAISYIAPDTLTMMFSRRIRPGQMVASKLFTMPMHVILRKGTPNAEALMVRVEKALASLQ